MLTRVKVKKILYGFAGLTTPFYNSINEYFFAVIGFAEILTSQGVTGKASVHCKLFAEGKTAGNISPVVYGVKWRKAQVY